MGGGAGGGGDYIHLFYECSLSLHTGDAVQNDQPLRGRAAGHLRLAAAAGHRVRGRASLLLPHTLHGTRQGRQEGRGYIR